MLPNSSWVTSITAHLKSHKKDFNKMWPAPPAWGRLWINVIKQWTTDSVRALQGCFKSTDWDNLLAPSSNMSEQVLLSGPEWPQAKVALTSLVMKALERIIKNHIITTTDQVMDNRTFAYHVGRGVDDVKTLILDTVHKYVEKPNTTGWCLQISPLHSTHYSHTSCSTDIVPSHFLTDTFDVDWIHIELIIDSSLASGVVSTNIKHAVVQALLKQPNIDT